jgi:hypothetical protein
MPTQRNRALITLSVTHSPIAERDSDHAGSRTGARAGGAGSAVIGPILPGCGPGSRRVSRWSA